MVETLSLPENGSKDDIYRALLPQVEAVISGTDDLIANLANTAAMLMQAFDFHWAGFYRATGPAMLTLGPFQGPLACVTIPFDKGVCGAAATAQKTIRVADVEKFPGHIACSSLSKSEIVVPITAGGKTQLVLDIDSDMLDAFDAVDQIWLERVAAVIAARHFPPS